MKLNQLIDHTLLHQQSTSEQIDVLCREAKEHQFFSVCVPPTYVQLAKKNLLDSDVKICTVIGFPFGYHDISSKNAELKTALLHGADELDAVLNIAAIKNENWVMIEKEFEQLCKSKEDKILKVIIESGILTQHEIETLCKIANNYPVDYLKTSTGFATQGATEEAVTTMRSLLHSEIKIKASGGIRTKETALRYVQLGADRLGCSSSVQIVS